MIAWPSWWAMFQFDRTVVMFIGAGACALVGIWFSLCVFRPALRAKVVWKGSKDPVSAIGSAAWALNAFIWSAILLIGGLGHESILNYAVWLVGGGFVLIALAAIYDSYASPSGARKRQ